jgi:putative ABC transport system substrate-binding protein
LRIALVSRAAGGEAARLPALAAELVAEKVDVVFANAPAAVRAAQAAAANVPVVGLDLESDPVASGFVSSLHRPGGNVTGVFLDFPEFGTKWVELLREVSPQVARVGILWDPSTGPLQRAAVEKAAGLLGIEARVVEVSDLAGMGPAFRRAAGDGAQALVLLSSPLFGSNPATSAQLAVDSGLPAVSLFPEFARAGGLLAYGPNLLDLYRQAGVMAGRVLAGTSPADLPVERPALFQLVVNLAAARALALDVPRELLLRADEVIE